MPIVGSSMYDRDGRKYIDIDGKQIKVPWKFNRVFGVEIKGGIKTVQELLPGDIIEYETIKRIWNGSVFYVLKSIKT